MRGILLGILACVLISLAAHFISGHFDMPVMVTALLLGMVFHFLSQHQLTKQGVQFTSQTVLRIGVSLIGVRIIFGDMIALGGMMIIIIVIATVATIFLGIFLARVLGLDQEQGLLIGGATAICGASAALAISSVMPRSEKLEQNTLVAVIGVTTMGTIAMLTYPFILIFLGMNHHDAGVMIGGTIHDVSQVVGAGYSISEESGDIAIIVKLIRVFMLLPLIFILAFIFGKDKEEGKRKKLPIPLFLIGFLALVILNTSGFLPDFAAKFLKDLSTAMLVMSITAVGMKTSFKNLCLIGWRPFILVASETLALALLYFFVIRAFSI